MTSTATHIKRLAWVTDIHLDFVSYGGVAEFCRRVARASCDALVITGDIGESTSVGGYLETLARSSTTRRGCLQPAHPN